MQPAIVTIQHGAQCEIIGFARFDGLIIQASKVATDPPSAIGIFVVGVVGIGVFPVQIVNAYALVDDAPVDEASLPIVTAFGRRRWRSGAFITPQDGNNVGSLE